MALNPIERESNLRDSLKKFFVESCAPHNIPLQFDRTLAQPNLRDGATSHWLSISIGKVYYMNARNLIDVLCNVCTRQDPEGYNNIRISDFVRGLLQDNAQTDGLARIPIYDFDAGTGTVIGIALPVDISAGVEVNLEDQTNVKPLAIRLWYAV